VYSWVSVLSALRPLRVLGPSPFAKAAWLADLENQD
jgi:hypothetical protein